MAEQVSSFSGKRAPGYLVSPILSRHLPFTGWGAADGEPKSYKDDLPLHSLFKDSVSIFLSCKRLKEKKLWFSRPAGAQQLVRSVTAT